jgi:uncharacterized membrane protein
VNNRIVLGLLTALGVLLFVAPFAPPDFRALGMASLAEAFDHPRTLTCHRLPERTMSIFGTKMAMCSRCTGVVTGLGLGLIVGRPYRGPNVLWITVGIASALLVLELQTQAWGLHPVWHTTRVLTGFLLAYPVAAAVRALFQRAYGPRSRKS